MPFLNKSPLNYPANSFDSIRIFQDDRAPTVTDFRNFIIGDEWWDTSSNDFWKLVFKDSTQGIWRKMAGTAAAAEFFTPDAGGQVGPDAANNINLLGGGGITTTGTPGTNTITIAPSSGGSLIETLTGDSGGAVGPDGSANINLLGGTSGFTFVGTPGTNTLTFTTVDQQQVIYVGKHGNDASDGTTIEKAKLTIAAGITTATPLAPAVVVIEDNGNYTENLTFPDNISLNAPNAILTGTTTLGDENHISLGKVVLGAGNAFFKNSGTVSSFVAVKEMNLTGAANGFVNNAGSLNVSCRLMTIVNGVGVFDASLAGEQIHASFEEVSITGTGTGITRVLAGTTFGDIDYIRDTGSGRAFNCQAGELNITVNKIETDTGIDINLGTANVDCEILDAGTTAYDVLAGGTLNLDANVINGTETAAAGSSVNGANIETGIFTNTGFTLVNPETTSTLFEMTSVGERTMVLQPAFLAYNSVTDVNQTGAGAGVTVEFDTEVFDQNADYNNTTDTFTASVTGRYNFETRVVMTGITAAMSGASGNIITSNRSYQFGLIHAGNIRDVDNQIEFHTSILADMDAADTATVQVAISGGAGNTAGIIGAAAPETRFSGQLAV